MPTIITITKEQIADVAASAAAAQCAGNCKPVQESVQLLRVTRAQIAAAAQCSFHYHFPCTPHFLPCPFPPSAHFRGFSIMSSYVSAGNLRWQLQLSACKLPHLPPTCSGIQGIPTVRRDSPCSSLSLLSSLSPLFGLFCVLHF